MAIPKRAIEALFFKMYPSESKHEDVSLLQFGETVGQPNY